MPYNLPYEGFGTYNHLNIGACFFCVSALSGSSVKNERASSGSTPVDSNVCAIAANPDDFDGKLLRLDAFISLAFEDSMLHDAGCPEFQIGAPSLGLRGTLVWAELADQAGYWRVKGFAPLVNDENLQKFHAVRAERSHIRQMTRATMIGTFYAGKRKKDWQGQITPLRGFGHKGCCSLFVISQIESVEKNYSDELDYSEFYPPGWAGRKDGCSFVKRFPVPPFETIREWQKSRNEGVDGQHRDPVRVAEEQLQILRAAAVNETAANTSKQALKMLRLSAERTPNETFLDPLSTSSLRIYEFSDTQREIIWEVTVARPYWLELLARSPNEVVWAPVRASIYGCELTTTPSKKHQP